MGLPALLKGIGWKASGPKAPPPSKEKNIKKL